MTEERFTELVNLYLDQEISECSLRELECELATNPERKSEFRARCQLHQAMRLVLDPDAPVANNGDRRSDQTPSKSVPFVRWFLGTGLAASFAVGIVLMVPELRNEAAAGSQSRMGRAAGGEFSEGDPLDSVGRVEFRRYATVRAERSSNWRASLAAELRLLGLRPEVAPREKELRRIDLAAVQVADSERDPVRLLEEIQRIEAVPTPRILRIEAEPMEPASRWPSGFQSSLASF